MKSSCIYVVIFATVFTSLTHGQSLFTRKPSSGDSCGTYIYSSVNPVLNAFLQRLGNFRCPDGSVVDSNGICVQPSRSDRCLPKTIITEAYLRERCAGNPTLKLADPFSCSNYYDCAVRIGSISCQQGTLFDDVSKICASMASVDCRDRRVDYAARELQTMCGQNQARVLARYESCNSYFNCSKTVDPLNQMEPFESECPYLQLWDADTKSCRPAGEVRCDARPEVKNPCDLKQFSCGRSSHCRPCWVDNPDCSTLPDGNNAIPGQEFSPRYARCNQGRTLGVEICQPVSPYEPRLFDPRMGQCASVLAIPRSLGGQGPDV